MILITGCTGFVGSSLVRQLFKEGKEVRGVARHPHCRKDPNLPSIEVIAGDIRSIASLRPAMKDVDTVIHLVGILVESGDSTFDRVHDEGTRNLVDVAKDAGVKRFLHMSALGTRPHAASRYHRSKWRAEEYVRQSGLDYTIFRPSVIFGPYDNFTNLFARIIKLSPVMPLLGDGRHQMQPIWVEDVARCFAKALEDPATIGQSYSLGGPEAISFKDMMDEILRAMDKYRIKLPVPFSLLRLEASILETWLPTPPLTTDQLIMAQEENVCDPQPMIQTFGFQPRGFREGIEEYLGKAATILH